MLGALGFLMLAWTIAPMTTKIINSSKQVAEACAVMQEDGVVSIAFNYGSQPSLPYYLLQNGFLVQNDTQVSDEDLYGKAIQENKTLFILNADQYVFFNKQTDADIPAKRIQTLMIDRLGSTDYYLIHARDVQQ